MRVLVSVYRLCEAWSYEFLKWYSEQDSHSDAPLYLRKLLNNQTPAYGDGLRAAVAAMADLCPAALESSADKGTMTATRLQELVVHVKALHDFPKTSCVSGALKETRP